ncbi:MAG: hypothetical protein K6C94_03400 [Candidatus Gastranaerophilales bacterium]|nr:hypothetical protein [Candidatus Gastranaerophilales bacterium]
MFYSAGYFATAQYDRCVFVTGLPRRAILALLAMTAYFFASEAKQIKSPHNEG